MWSAGEHPSCSPFLQLLLRAAKGSVALSLWEGWEGGNFVQVTRKRQPEQDQSRGLSMASQLFPFHCFKSKVENGRLASGLSSKTDLLNTGGRNCSSTSSQGSGTLQSQKPSPTNPKRERRCRAKGRLEVSSFFFLAFFPLMSACNQVWG